MTSLFLIAFLTLLVSLALTRVMIAVRIADIPTERSSHTVATPKGGGVAIIFSLMLFASLCNILLAPIFSPDVQLLMLLSATMGIVGILDDVFHLSYKPRLLAQLAVAGIMIINGFSLHYIPLPGVEHISLGALGPMLTVLWIVGFINAFNFMDGLNGLAAGGALAVSVLTLIFLDQMSPMYLIFYGLIFALLGYLRYNFHYGRIFMSDIGSQFLGTFFAVSTLMIEPATDGQFRFYIIPLLFLPFIFDTSLTFILRLIHKKSVLTPHKEFLFHRLVALGWSHTQVAVFYFSMIIFQGFFVKYFLQHPSFGKLGWNFAAYGLLAFVIHRLSRPLYHRSKHAKSTG